MIKACGPRRGKFPSGSHPTNESDPTQMTALATDARNVRARLLLQRASQETGLLILAKLSSQCSN